MSERVDDIQQSLKRARNNCPQNIRCKMWESWSVTKGWEQATNMYERTYEWTSWTASTKDLNKAKRGKGEEDNDLHWIVFAKLNCVGKKTIMKQVANTIWRIIDTEFSCQFFPLARLQLPCLFWIKVSENRVLKSKIVDLFCLRFLFSC